MRATEQEVLHPFSFIQMIAAIQHKLRSRQREAEPPRVMTSEEVKELKRLAAGGGREKAELKRRGAIDEQKLIALIQYAWFHRFGGERVVDEILFVWGTGSRSCEAETLVPAHFHYDASAGGCFTLRPKMHDPVTGSSVRSGRDGAPTGSPPTAATDRLARQS